MNRLPRIMVLMCVSGLTVHQQAALGVTSEADSQVNCVTWYSDTCGACDKCSARPASCPNLTGDWLGLRGALVEHGISFEGDVTQYYQGVSSGGLNRTFDYGGHADYVFNADLSKLGAWQGCFLKLRGESQFGTFVNRESGAILAVNNEGLLPVPGEQATALTNVLFTQFVTERTAVFVGKLDTLDGDANAFAHGRGKNQFFNAALVINPIAFRTVPYSTYGTGILFVQESEPVFSLMAIDPVDHATEGPSDLFVEGVTLAAEWRLPTRFFGRPGHQLFGGTWSSRDVPDLSRLLVPPGTPIPATSDSWSVYWNFDQFVSVDANNADRGWGVFGRAGIADDVSNPLAWFLSFGLGGNRPFASRPADTFGCGWFLASVSDQLPPALLSDYGQGLEFYYNFAVTSWLHVTPDLQVVDPSRPGVDPAVVAGIRVKMDL